MSEKAKTQKRRKNSVNSCGGGICRSYFVYFAVFVQGYAVYYRNTADRTGNIFA